MAKKTATYSSVLPVLNISCSIPTTVPLPLSDDVSLRKIRGDDLAAITEGDDSAATYMKGGIYTITFDPYDPSISSDEHNLKILTALFSLNVIGTGSALSVEKSFVVKSHRVVKLENVDYFSIHKHGNSSKFEIEKGSDLSQASNVYRSTLIAMAKHKQLRITISRFNSAMGRVSIADKVIDLCISLESIFESQTEISFQFALYNAILSEDDVPRRESIYRRLRDLYRKRSSLVHGSGEIDQNWIDENWQDLVRIAKASILQKINFLQDKEHSEWKQNLEALALGVGAKDGG